MNERVKELRKVLDLTLEKFGEKVGVGKAAMSLIEKGKNNVTDQMFKSICREFNVNEEWLRTGKGPMFVQFSKKEQIENIVKNVLSGSDEFVQNAFIALGELRPDDWKIFEKIIDRMNELNSKKSSENDLFANIPEDPREVQVFPEDESKSAG